MADDGRDGPSFGELVGLRTLEMEDGVARVVLDAGPQHLNPHGTVHGGAIATLADTAMGSAVVAADDEASPATIEMKVTYIEPGRPGEILATARVRKKGRHISIVEAEITQEGELIAHAISTFTV
jgi:uncharacterized protein (TIGR00369 family)